MENGFRQVNLWEDSMASLEFGQNSRDLTSASSDDTQTYPNCFLVCHKLSKYPSMHHSAGVRTHIDYKILSEWPTMRQRRSPPLPSGIRLETVVGFWRGVAIAIQKIGFQKRKLFFPTVWWKMAEICYSILFWFDCRFVPWSRALSVLLNVLFSNIAGSLDC